MKRITSFKTEINSILDFTPIVFEGDPLLLAELSNTHIEKDIWNYIQLVDNPDPVVEQRTILLGPNSNYYDRWPIITSSEKVPSDLLKYNQCLFDNFDQVMSYAFNQQHISDRIIEDTEVDVIVLLLIDGLSYTDWMNYPNIKSCLVPGPSITPIGFKNIIGKPSIAEQLFKKKFVNRLGFSHWDRDEDLSNELFFGFDKKLQIKKISEFGDIFKTLSISAKNQTYIQIIINGLDYISHHHRGRPPVDLLAKNLYENIFLLICDFLHKQRITAFVYAASDHGILWKQPSSGNPEFIDVPDGRVKSHRYAKGSFLIPNCREFSCFGETFQSLKYPYILRPLSTLEWGVHGGISFQESVIPFAKEEVY